MKVKSLSRVLLFVTPWTVAYQAPPSMGFSRQEYWNGLPFPSPGAFPDPGIEPWSPTFQADALTSDIPACKVVSDSATPWTSLPGSSVHGISQARILEWVAIAFSESVLNCIQTFPRVDLVKLELMKTLVAFMAAPRP